VILDYGHLSFVYFLGFKKEISYKDIEEYDVESFLRTINIKVKGKEMHMSFYYSPKELEEIENIFQKYNIGKAPEYVPK
jgi:hypothetical protein